MEALLNKRLTALNNPNKAGKIKPIIRSGDAATDGMIVISCVQNAACVASSVDSN